MKTAEDLVNDLIEQVTPAHHSHLAAPYASIEVSKDDLRTCALAMLKAYDQLVLEGGTAAADDDDESADDDDEPKGKAGKKGRRESKAD